MHFKSNTYKVSTIEYLFTIISLMKSKNFIDVLFLMSPKLME
jgi:hypothetical protein